MELLSGVQIVSLVGPQGAGKSTVGDVLASRFEAGRVEASSVVRDVCGDIPRADMPKTNRRTKSDPEWLGKAIAKVIGQQSIVVLTGVRETEVHDTLKLYDADLYIACINASIGERFMRQQIAGKCKSWDEFYSHELNELSIGLTAVMASAHYCIETSFKSSPIEVVDMIVNLLDNEDWE